MDCGTSALDVRPPTLTPVNGKLDQDSSFGGVQDVEYTLKPAKRAYASTARLNLQHYLWKDQTGYLLHPSIPLSGVENLKIADVGTGTGIWLLDLARTLPPTAQLDGFDIDISDCPPAPWLPRNVTMRRLDALGAIPEHLTGAYDVVQLRLFQVVVRDNDPGPLLRNMLKMLKPGGYLQWGEYDMTTQTTIKASPSLSASALDAIPAFVQGFQKKDARIGVQNWIPNLPTHFHTHHLTSIATARHPTTSPFLPYQLDVFLLTYEELAAKTFDVIPGGHGHGDRLRSLIEAASEEGRKGVGWGMDRLVVVGRKGDGRRHVAGGGVGEEDVSGVERGGMGAEGKGVGLENVAGGGGSGEAVPEAGSAEPGVHGTKEKRASRRASWLKIWKRMNSSF